MPCYVSPRDLDGVVDRLHRLFPDATIDLIRREVQTVTVEDFGDARIPAYLSILIQRAARERLQDHQKARTSSRSAS